MTQRIVYLSWPATEITGGIKLVFRHVEILREAGFDAVVATPDGEPPQWLETTAPLLDVSQVGQEEDVLVFPENHLGLLQDFGTRPNRKVVFCQNPFMVFRGLGGQRDYREFGVSAILAEGNLATEFCRRRFPGLPLRSVPVMVDQAIFRFQANKKLQIALAPRKRPMEAAFVQDLFRATHPEWRAIPWIEISGRAESEVAALLKDSAVYLSLCRFEAVPLSIVEAFACGCVVAGFTGVGGREYTTAKNGFWAEEDDCLGCAEQLARAVRLITAGGPAHGDLLEAASIAASYYSRQRLAARLTEFWKKFLGEEAPAAGPPQSG